MNTGHHTACGEHKSFGCVASRGTLSMNVVVRDFCAAGNGCYGCSTRRLCVDDNDLYELGKQELRLYRYSCVRALGHVHACACARV